MTDLELKRLCDAATPGPWSIEHDHHEQANIYAEGEHGREWIAILPHQCVTPIEQQRARDAAFVAAARSALPALLERAQRAERERDWAVDVQRAALESQERLAAELTIGQQDLRARLDAALSQLEAHRDAALATAETLRKWLHAAASKGSAV